VGAYGINNARQIVGGGLYNGEARAFRLDPLELQASSAAPEPGSWLLAGLGLVLLLVRRKQ